MEIIQIEERKRKSEVVVRICCVTVRREAEMAEERTRQKKETKLAQRCSVLCPAVVVLFGDWRRVVRGMNCVKVIRTDVCIYSTKNKRYA